MVDKSTPARMLAPDAEPPLGVILGWLVATGAGKNGDAV
jgi:hypothetical protein